MNQTIDQANAILALLRRGSPPGDDDVAPPSRTLGLCSELVALGEYRLVVELCNAVNVPSLSDRDRMESLVLSAEALIGLGKIDEALRLTELVLTGEPDPADLPSLSLWHRALIQRARSLWRSLDFHGAKELLLAERERLLRLPDSSLLGWCSLFLGNASWSLGDMESARRYFTEATASAYRNRDVRLEATAALSTGLMKRSMCHWNEASDDLNRAYLLWTGIGNHSNVAHALRSLALVDLKRGRPDAAATRATEASSLAASIGSEESHRFALEVLAICRVHQGDFGEATLAIEQAMESSGGRGAARANLLASEFLGDIHLESGDSNSALSRYDDAMTRATAVAPRGDIVAELRRRRAECFYLLGRHEEAFAEAGLGLEHTRELGDRYEEAATYRVTALAAAALGRAEEAKQLFEQGFALFEDIETPYEWGKLWMAFGDWLAADRSGAYHDPRMAVEAYHAAHYRFETMGAKAKLAEVNARIARAASPPRGSLVPSDAPVAAAQVRTPPRPRPSRGRELDRKTQWAREQFGIITANPAIFDILEIVEKLARSRSAVLVLGESGTGKELIAHALHKLSGRKGEFMAINCATLPKDVIESELFGHVAGAFTGASREKVGLLEVCEGGTVFLDEVSEMSLELQSRLLRFLESGEIRRVGATRVTKLSTRIVAASNREEADLRSGQEFRSDLYYRLAHTVVKLPALRLRGARDIELLAEHFLEISCAEEHRSLVLTDGALRKLVAYSWPGNIRELRSTMSQRAVLTPDGANVEAEHLRLEDDAGAAPGTLGEELAQTERRRIEEALRLSRNSKADAARLLGIPRTTLINRIQRLGIQTT